MAKSVVDPGFPVGGGGGGEGHQSPMFGGNICKNERIDPIGPNWSHSGWVGGGHSHRRSLDLSMQVARTQD